MTPARILCRNHSDREPAGRCPSCGDFFCVECLTEHDGRILCRTCLAGLAVAAAPPRSGSALQLAAMLALSFLTLWFSFYAMGRLLVQVPAAYHDGTFWSPR